ncbi:transposase, MuDR, MULE transposase domain protein [Tanacetum coccineum]|uniref:Transposase, MuDR, MULE transposase domain protein n=1 Tax=Tanacetum coccineum TaxID=301880 RepID=A0ABQ5ASW8_9ASTR
MSEDLTYSSLHEMMMKKFNLEANSQINLSFKLSSFDYTVDITDDDKLESLFAFRANDKNVDENNDSDDVVDENPQTMYHKWNKFMSFKPDIPDIPVYKSKPMISKQYSQESEVKEGNIFDNKEALVLAVRLKALNDSFKFLVDRSAPERCHLKCYNYKQCDWKLHARLWDTTDQYYITHLNDVHTCPKTQTFPNHQNANKKIRMFLNCLRHLIIIDAMHLKGLYKGTNLVDMGMDENNQIVPIAFGICKGETCLCWTWWMSVLKECIGDNPNLLFISDRHPTIALAVQNEFLLAFHAIYFAKSMRRLQLVQPDAYQKLCEAGTQRWSRAHCPLVRYNYMTSNSVESVNAYIVLHRKIPVLKLAEPYCEMVQEWFTSPPGREFVGERVATIDPVKLDTFSTDQVKLILTNCLGYDGNSPTFLYIKKPNCSFDSGLVLLDDAIQERDIILTFRMALTASLAAESSWSWATDLHA